LIDALAGWRLSCARPRHASCDAPLAGADWDALLSAAVAGRLSGQLAWAIADDELEADSDQRVAAFAAHRRAMANVCVLEQRLLDVDDAFHDAGIDYRVLKGPAVAHLDELDPSLRSFCDLDLLVRAEQIEAARDLLLDAGGRRRYPEPRHHFDRRFSKGMCILLPGGSAIDVHRTLAPGPFGMRLDLDDVFAGIESFTVGGRALPALDRPRRFVHACFHAMLGQAEPAPAQLRDVVVTCPRDDGVMLHALAIAEHSDACEVVSAAVRATMCTIGWQPPAALTAELSRRRPTARRERWLRSYHTESRSGAARALWTLDAVAGIRAKAAYALAVVLPTNHAGATGRLARLRHGLARPARAAIPAPVGADPVSLEVEDHLVLYDRSASRVHLLNPTAAAIWWQVVAGKTTGDISAELAGRADLGPPTVARDVARTSAEFAALGLLGASRSAAPVVPRSGLRDATRACRPSQHARVGGGSGAMVGPLAALDHRFVVGCPDSRLATRLRAGFASLPACRPEEVTRYELVGADDRGWTVVLDGRIVRRSATVDDALGFLWWHVQRVAVEGCARLVRLHAAGIGRGGSVIAMPAPSGAGKSTLVTGLVAHGYDFVSDEAVAFEPASREVYPLALPIKLHRASVDVLPGIVAHAESTAGMQHVLAQRVGAAAEPDMASPARLVACVFHRFDPNGATEMRRLTPPEALVALLENAFGLDTADGAIFDGLRRVALELPCYQLVRDDIAGAIDSIDSITRVGRLQP
jgi:hypothetical protein